MLATFVLFYCLCSWIGNGPVMKCAKECDFSAFPVSQIHNFDNKYSRSTCFIQCWHRWCCKWIKDLWTSNSVYIDIHPTQYHYNQQALELPHKCAHISSIVSLEISMSLFLHSCWLIVQIIPCDSVVFFPTSAVTVLSIWHVYWKVDVTIHVLQNVYVGISVLQVNPLSLLKAAKVMMGNTFVQIWAETSLFCLEQLWMDNKWVDYWRQCLYFKEVSFRSMAGSQSSWAVVCLEPDFQRNSWSPGEQHHLLCFRLSSEILLWCNSPSTPTQFLEVAVKQVNSVNSVDQSYCC